MNFLEIGVPLASNALTLFIGSGFSKYLTDGKAPSWLELLVDLTAIIDNKNKTMRNKLFNSDSSDNVTSTKIELSICAQILELEFLRKHKNIRQEVAGVIANRINGSTVNKKKISKLRKFFIKHQKVNIITTNYDMLLSEYILFGSGSIVVNGSPIPQSNISGTIFHIHGCISNPDSIVVTINDYFRFQNEDSYLSRKFYTLLQETTVVILGYSLGDFNLNSIFNEAQTTRDVSLRKSNIYLVSRESVDQMYKYFYSFTYGIKVIDELDIDDFFLELSGVYEGAEKIVNEATILPDVLVGKARYTDDFLKLRNSLSEIFLQASMIGASLKDPPFIELIIDIIERKKKFTYETGAWNQYDHLAEWLIDVGSTIDLEGTSLEKPYLGLVDYSFSTMSKELCLGYSWDAFTTWKNRFRELHIKNQKLIEKFIKKKGIAPLHGVREVIA